MFVHQSTANPTSPTPWLCTLTLQSAVLSSDEPLPILSKPRRFKGLTGCLLPAWWPEIECGIRIGVTVLPSPLLFLEAARRAGEGGALRRGLVSDQLPSNQSRAESALPCQSRGQSALLLDHITLRQQDHKTHREREWERDERKRDGQRWVGA